MNIGVWWLENISKKGKQNNSSTRSGANLEGRGI